MLLYRPVLSAYKQTTQPAARRWLLREFAHPLLHAEPDELLAQLASVREVTCAGEPARLAAEMALRERSLRLNLSTRDSQREMGGLWTAHAESRAVLDWMASATGAPELARAAGAALGEVALALVKVAPEHERALLLAALGELGPDVAGEPLRAELVSGALPGAAALGLARLGPAALEEAVLPAVQARKLPACAPWLGPALAAAPSPGLAGLLGRLARSAEPEVREQAAHALGSLSPEQATPLFELFEGEKDRFVRLNAILSLARLGVPGGRATLRRFYRSSDPELVRTALIRAAGRSTLEEVRPFLERALAGTPEEVAEALQALVCLGSGGAEFIESARAAAKSPSARLMLHGLLALAIWAPDECFARLRKVFGGAPSAAWFPATYVLRYLRTDQTVPLLTKLLKAFRSTELEEIAVSALCRHLDQPGALTTLLALAKAGTQPVVLARLMGDLARHLPEDQAGQAGDAIRTMLKPGQAGQGPLLIALGSFGGPTDLDLLVRFVPTAAVEDAIHGIELLMQPSAAPVLEKVIRAKGPGTREALVALFRLGDPRAAELIAPFADAADDVPLGSRAVVEILLSVKHARSLGRLAHLYGSLSEKAKRLSAPPAREVKAVQAGPSAREIAEREQAAAKARALSDLAAVLDRPRRPVAAGAKIPDVRNAPPDGTGDHVYADLGRVFRADARAGGGARIAIVACAVLLVVGLAGLAWWRFARRAAGNVDEVGLHSRFPPLYSTPGDPEDHEVKPGDLIEGTKDAPVKLVTRIKDDTLEVSGKLRAGTVTFSKDVPPTARLEASLMAGTLDVKFPRGVARIAVEGARTTVEIEGSAHLEMKESTFVMNVDSGKATTFRGVIQMKTLTTGQSGEFLDGTPMGRIEDGH